MEKSLFIEWVKKYLKGITIQVTNKLNDTQRPLVYLHKQMLQPDFSVSGKWESINVAGSMVMADVVAMDSSLPLKKRDSISKASGDIPKMGMELKLNERQLTDLDTLVAQGGTTEQILAKLFEDTPKVIGGIYERNEAMFLEGLSTGVTLVEDDDTVGTGVRVDYGYLNANKFGVSILWNDADNAKPFNDIDKVINKASTDGNTPTVVLLDKSTFRNIAATKQARQLFAFHSNIPVVETGSIPSPSLNQLNSYTSDQYGFEFKIIDRAVRKEKNGKQTTVKPWSEGKVIFLPSAQIGKLVYARLAEQNHPVDGVTYQTVENYILVSKYRQNKPSLSEYTSSQSRVVPVINNVDSIYQLDSKTVQG